MLTKKILFALVCLSLTHLSFANQSPQSLATDPRIKTVLYDPNNVVTIRGSHLVATGIQFARDETVITAKVGDTIAWLTEVSQNRIYIKPVLPNSDTNLLVVTNKRTYQFHLITHEADSAHSKNVTYLLNFKYRDELNENLKTLQKDFISNVSNESFKWNNNYSFVGSHQIAPIQAFDNGTYTLFKFRKHTPLPAIFAVDNHRNERLVNFHVQGDYVLVQGIHAHYTFRSGNEIVSIYNDNEGA